MANDSQALPKIFLSYARDDDEPFVRRLYSDLCEHGFTVWFDRVSLPSRQLTFHQEIKDAIRTEADRIVLIAGPGAAMSDYVREEWLFALTLDRPVLPILRLGDFDLIPGALALFHCEDFRKDTNYPSSLNKLENNLKRPEPPLGSLHGVPSLPEYFLARPEFMRRVKDALMVDLHKPLVLTGAGSRVGIQGMGGIGKSVLAAAVARDREVRRAYPDGVLWVSVGQEPNILQIQRELALALDYNEADDGILDSETLARSALQALLADKAVLLTIDDVWDARHAKAFDVLGPRGRALVTTRDAGILGTFGGDQYLIELFTEEQSLQYLADATGVSRQALSEDAIQVARECGRLPLALALCAGMARKRYGDWSSVLIRLQRADLEKIRDRHAINPDHESIWRAMQISVDVLEDEEQLRFSELAVFATDRSVPEAAVATLWAHTGDLNDLDSEELLIELGERSLIRLETTEVTGSGRPLRRVSLHDLLHDYTRRIGPELTLLHSTILDAYRNKCMDGWASGPDDGYFFQELVHHQALAEQWDDVACVLTNLEFLEAKVRAGLIAELQMDYSLALAALPEAQVDLDRERKRQKRLEKYALDLVAYAKGELEHLDIINSIPLWADQEIDEDTKRIAKKPTRLDSVRLFGQFVRREAHSFHKCGEYLRFVVQQAFNQADSGPIAEAAAEILEEDNNAPVFLKDKGSRPLFSPHPACLRTLEGHTGPIRSVALSSNGKWAVSGGGDNMLRVWDLETGTCFRVLEGHTSYVSVVGLSTDGKRIVSGSRDNTLRVWDLETGACLKTLEGSTGGVESVVLSPDGKLAVSGGGETSLRVWDLETGTCLRHLKGHSSYNESISLSSDGKLAISGSRDTTLRVWDLETGACLRTLTGHTSVVRSVVMSPDGKRAISGSLDTTLRVWDLGTGVCLRTLKGHTSEVNSVALSPDGKLAVSGSDDRSVRVWHLETGTCLSILDGHRSRVMSLSLRSDSKLAVSGSWDSTLRVWDLETCSFLRTNRGHTDSISSVALRTDGMLAVSGSWDASIRVWDQETRVCKRILEGHSNAVSSVALSPDGKWVVSGSDDHSVRVWDLGTGVCLRNLEGHTSIVSSVALSLDGEQAVTGSWDTTLRVWSLRTGVCLKTLKGHTKFVSSIALSTDRSIAVSGSWDTCLRVWDLETGGCLRIIEGHTSYISSVALSTDGRQAVSGSRDSTIRVWDLDTGACIRIIEGHVGGVESVALSPDGIRAVSVGSDHKMRVWDLETGKCLLVAAVNGIFRFAACFDTWRLVYGTTFGHVCFGKLYNLK